MNNFADLTEVKLFHQIRNLVIGSVQVVIMSERPVKRDFDSWLICVEFPWMKIDNGWFPLNSIYFADAVRKELYG
jgi:hypothetical protein